MLQEEVLARIQATFDRVITGPDKLVLEAGCGSASRLKVTRGTLIGIDLSKNQLDRNPILMQKIVGDLQTFDLGVDRYDAIVCWDVLEHLPKPQQALRRFYRALKPEGVIILKAPLRSSIFGHVTRMTPLWFHRLYYRTILGTKIKASEDVGPFPTHYHSDMAPEAIAADAQSQGMRFCETYKYEQSQLRRLRRQNLLVRCLMLGPRLLSLAVYRDERLLMSSFAMIIRK